jgi:hypothetical protein
MRTLQRSFAGGVITPELYGRIDLSKFQTGLAECQNFLIQPHGPAASRPGFEFVKEVKTSAKATRVIPFSFSTTQTYALEFGDQYIRFYTQGGQLLTGTVTAWVTATVYTVGDIRSNGGINYYCQTAHTSGTFATDLAALRWYVLTGTIVEVPTPYLEADLFNLHFVQSADVLTIVHPSYAPRELRRLGATRWTLTSITFAPTISAPTSPAVVATTGTGTTTYKYVITAVSSDGLDESVATSMVSCTNNLTTAGNKNTVSWAAVSGAVRYYVYKEENGAVYGYIGQSDGTSFIDQNVNPDSSVTPPTSQNPFSSANNYPQSVSYFEQRRVFAGTNNKPQTLWLTRSATESNMNYSIPTQDNDAMIIKVAAREANTIRHLVPLSDLVLLTSGGEWKCSAGSADALTPTTIQVKPQSYMGASNVQPVVTGNSILYSADRGAKVREISYSWEAQSYRTVDASIMAPHLFDGYGITDMAYMRSPYQVLWCVRSDGALLGLTYVPDQQVLAWHTHTTDGQFESVCVIAEGSEDVLYVVVKRTIGGSTKRYVERLRSRQFSVQEDAFFVDSGLTYSGAAVTTISGLGHLEGKQVVALANGAVVGNLTVNAGAITLPASATKVHVGLPITAKLRTLPATIDSRGIGAFGQGYPKNINAVHLRVYRSAGIFVGPSEDKLVEYKQRTNEVWGAPPGLKSDEIEVVLSPTWSRSGQIYVQHDDPLPLTVVSLSLDVALGG